jgi:hypothetical protein
MEIEKDNIYSTEDIDRHEGQIIEDAKAASIESIPDPDAWLEETKRNILLTSVDAAINWARRSSMWTAICFPACCAFELIAAEGPRFDLSRFGMEILRASGAFTTRWPSLNGSSPWALAASAAVFSAHRITWCRAITR